MFVKLVAEGSQVELYRKITILEDFQQRIGKC
jgi:hypothetical protein